MRPPKSPALEIKRSGEPEISRERSEATRSEIRDWRSPSSEGAWSSLPLSRRGLLNDVSKAKRNAELEPIGRHVRAASQPSRTPTVIVLCGPSCGGPSGTLPARVRTFLRATPIRRVLHPTTERLYPPASLSSPPDGGVEGRSPAQARRGNVPIQERLFQRVRQRPTASQAECILLAPNSVIPAHYRPHPVTVINRSPHTTLKPIA